MNSLSQSSKDSVTPINEHLFQIYPQMPKYAADPSQSDIIKTYDHIMLRFSGHYGRQPEYFVKAPLCPHILGDSHSYSNLKQISLCSNQAIIVAISSNLSKKIRINQFQTTLYGQIELSNRVHDWSFKHTDSDKNTEENLKNQYFNLILKVLKSFVQTNSMMELKGLDILVFKNFTEDTFLYSKEAFIYAIYSALHAAMLNKVPLHEKVLHKTYGKVSAESPEKIVQILPQLCHSSYNHLCLFDNQTGNSCLIPFPEKHSIIMANSMTPEPKKLIKGKRFNLRKCQVQIGLQLIMSELGLIKEVKSIKQLMDTMSCDLNEINDTIDSLVPNKALSAETIEELTQKSLIDILKEVPFANNVIDENLQFFPYKRLKYLINEQKRIDTLQSHPQRLFEILKQSSQDAASLLDIESEQIEDLLEVAKPWIQVHKIIGNGWGGNVLFICKDEHREKAFEDIMNNFYLSEKNKILLSDDVEMYLKIIGKPSTGLAILDPQNEIWYG